MVSILVPVYNASKYLRQCVDSLTGQTYTDLQIVLIDDGSTDDSWELMQEMAQEDPRLEVYSQPNCGVAATRNHLLEKVRGEFVLFVDSDDWIELNTIEVLMQEQQREDFDIVGYQIYGSINNDENHYNQEQIIKLFLEHIAFNGSLCIKLIRSELLQGLFLDENVSYGEDALLVWQVLQRVRRVATLKKHYYHYRYNDDSLSHQHFNGRRCTAYTAWEQICRDTDDAWPQFSQLAHARFACEMAQILRDAVSTGYNDRARICILQEEIRRDGHLIGKTGISSFKMRAFAWVVSRNYWLATILHRYLHS